ncbi:hypothetical protein GMA19_02496 [Paenibacillus polymyxa E681]|nr:hypothetical protein GE561_02496 [Paenibacillus polymyxa E681]QNV62163.1 hypothetical protein GMA19_02496 [Paenibacillus polymyxa E681]
MAIRHLGNSNAKQDDKLNFYIIMTKKLASQRILPLWRPVLFSFYVSVLHMNFANLIFQLVRRLKQPCTFLVIERKIQNFTYPIVIYDTWNT